MTLFDHHPQRLDGPATYSIPPFEYLNRSSRPAAVQVRQLFDAWFAQHPAEYRDDVRARFRSPDPAQHQGAAFELTICALLRAMGSTIDRVDEAQSTRGNPDFLVTPAVGPTYVLEATVAMGQDDASLAAERRANAMVDALSAVHARNYLLQVEITQAGSEEGSKRHLRAAAKSWLAKLDEDWTAQKTEPEHKDHTDRGWSIRLTAHPWPGAPEAPPIRSYGWSEITSTFSVPRKLETKLRSQRPDNLPFVIAINVLDWGMERAEAECLLFGEVARDLLAEQPERGFRNNGLLWRSDGFQHTRLSAVLAFSHLTPWSLRHRAAGWALHHPGARVPIPDGFDGLPNCRLHHGQMAWSDGPSPATTLGLPEHWPSDDA